MLPAELVALRAIGDGFNAIGLGRKVFLSSLGASYSPVMVRLEAAATLTRAAEARREATKREAIVKVVEGRWKFG